MKTHVFANLMYSLSDALGLWPKGRKTEMRNRTSYDAHKGHFAKMINDINARLHEGSNMPTNFHVNHLDVMENLCHCAMHTVLIRHPYTHQQIFDIYTKNILLPLIAADIAVFTSDTTECSLYYHLDKLLRIENISHVDNGIADINKKVAHQYLQKFVDNDIRSLAHADVVIAYLKNITKKGNQTAITINQKFSSCIHSLDNDKSLSSDNKESLRIKIASFHAAYLAFSVLQYLQTDTGLLVELQTFYKKMVAGSPLVEQLKSALGIDYRTHDANLISGNHLMEDKSPVIKKAFHILYGYFDIKVLEHTVSMPLLHEENFLSKMVTIPPQYVIPKVDSIDTYFNTYNAMAAKKDIIYFNKSFFREIQTRAASSRKDKQHFSHYLYLLDALDLMQHGKAEEALALIQDDTESADPTSSSTAGLAASYRVPYHELSPIGYLRYSLAVLKIGLMYLLRRPQIKFESLTAAVSNIVNCQGIITLHPPLILRPLICPPQEYINRSLFHSGTYNYMVIIALYAYNFTVARHTATGPLREDSHHPGLNRVNMNQLNYASPLIVRGLLDRLNHVCGKLLNALPALNIHGSPGDLLDGIRQQGVLTDEELTENLIHCINGSTLVNCLLDYPLVIQYLSVPGDNIKHIDALGQNAKVTIQLLTSTS